MESVITPWYSISYLALSLCWTRIYRITTIGLPEFLRNPGINPILSWIIFEFLNLYV